MMRLRHNTKFKGGGLDLGEAPSSVASPKEHLEFLRLFRDQMRQRQEEGEEHPHHGAEMAGDEDMLAANFAEAQIRALVNNELEACLVLHESKEFWQHRLDRPGANILNWIEMGPWTWKTHTTRDCCEYYLGSLSRCKRLLRNKILSAGSLQLHLTQMKQAYMEGTLSEWTAAALVLIQRTLEPSTDGITPVNSTTSGGSSTSRRRSRSSHPRRSLASALTSRDCSPTHRNGIWRRVRSDGSSVAKNTRGQSVLRRVLSLGRRDRHAQEFAQGGSGDGDDGQSEGGQQQVESSQGEEDATEEGDATKAHNCLKKGGDKPAAFRTSIEGTSDGSNRDPAGPPSPVPPGPEEEEAGLARADFADLLRDAQEGVEAGIGAGQEGDIIRALLRTSEELVATVETQQKNRIPLLLGRFAAPSRIRRNWMFIAVATPAALVAMFYMYRNRWLHDEGLQRWRQFVREHISEPFWGIYNELVHNQPLTLTDANALADSSFSLQRMLEAFIKDTKPNLSEGEVKKMARTGDMSVVSREYERSIINAWKNFVAGDIVRMMLIQVQFIKRELLIATTAIGQLARENELNLRMMATVPAFLLAWGSYRAVRPAYYWLKSEKSRESTFTAMCTIVLAMERLLNLRHREGTWLQLAADHPVAADEKKAEGEVGLPRRRGSLLKPLGHSDNCTRQVVVSAGRGQGLMAVRVLDELDLGKLMMLVHQVLRLIRSGPRRFPRRDLVNLHEDLAELVGERGLVSVGQQLQIVQRVQRSYKFLLPRR
ncbi:conserved unknown protein [Ectocarpus siliculosus]|uniref:Uncharacterized protein n=1 Tax=Ectocarpus siliculosus TaxID=2880 RepID=D7FV82_ECTSI|nr:conserved unknown protein [Ectocarpus siliculosus]|eukprot:CBJ26254.1 conserved unknown protein [Ectocarpus siliculosus]